MRKRGRWKVAAACTVTLLAAVIGCRGTEAGRRADWGSAADDAGPTVMLAAYRPQVGQGIQLEWQTHDRSRGRVLLDNELVTSALVPGLYCAVVQAKGLAPSEEDRKVACRIYVSRDGSGFELAGRAEGASGGVMYARVEAGAAYTFQVRQDTETPGNAVSSRPVRVLLTKNLVIDGGFEQAMPGLVEEADWLPDWIPPKRCRYEIGVYDVKGPRGNQFLSLMPPNQAQPDVRHVERVQSKNIRIPEGTALVQSGWVRCPGGQSRIYVGRTWYDARGRHLGETFSLVAASPRQWTFFRQRLVPGDTRPEELTRTDARIPQGAAIVRWTMRVEVGGEGVQMDELAIQADPGTPRSDGETAD